MSGFYLVGKEDLLSRDIPPEAAVTVFGVNDEYAYDASHTEFAIFADFILLPTQPLVNASFINGILKADEVVWLAAGAGVLDRSLNLQGIVVMFTLADAATLFAFIDSAQVGLPQTVTGVNVTAKWNPLGILKL